MVMLALKWVPPAKCLPLAAYCWAHGYGHYLFETGQAPPEISIVGVLNLAAILAIGPAKGMGTAVAAGIDKVDAALGAVLMEVLLVLVFVLGLGKSHHALLYINITIMFCVALPRLLFVGTSEESEWALRSDLPYFCASPPPLSVSFSSLSLSLAQLDLAAQNLSKSDAWVA